MDKKDILEFITKHPTAYLATIEGDKPRVRVMGTYKADENGIIFSMQSPKDVYKQLVANPEAEVCYFTEGIQIRVRGRMEEIKDAAVKEEILEKRKFYKPGVEKDGLDYVGAFILKNGKANVQGGDDHPRPAPGEAKDFIDL